MSDPSSDFFKYDLGYALYSQEMTDVGKLLVDNASDNTERIQAAIERDTLLIAKAVGPNLSLADPKNAGKHLRNAGKQDEILVFHPGIDN